MNTVSGKKQQLLRRRDVQVVDVPAWGCDSAQSGGDGEEDHSKCVVAARVSCRHQEQRRSKHSCTVDSVILSTVESVFIFCFFDGGPYRSGIGSSWLWLWELCGFPSGNRPTAHSARQTAHSPGKAEPTACRSVSRHDSAVGQGFSTRPPLLLPFMTDISSPAVYWSPARRSCTWAAAWGECRRSSCRRSGRPLWPTVAWRWWWTSRGCGPLRRTAVGLDTGHGLRVEMSTGKTTAS